jgi:hypothetical protein
MKEDNSYLIPIEGLEQVREGAFQGHLWASPSVDGSVCLSLSVCLSVCLARVL